MDWHVNSDLYVGDLTFAYQPDFYFLRFKAKHGEWKTKITKKYMTVWHSDLNIKNEIWIRSDDVEEESEILSIFEWSKIQHEDDLTGDVDNCISTEITTEDSEDFSTASYPVYIIEKDQLIVGIKVGIHKPVSTNKPV